jgi:hypothetical protein
MDVGCVVRAAGIVTGTGVGLIEECAMVEFIPAAGGSCNFTTSRPCASARDENKQQAVSSPKEMWRTSEVLTKSWQKIGLLPVFVRCDPVMLIKRDQD